MDRCGPFGERVSERRDPFAVWLEKTGSAGSPSSEPGGLVLSVEEIEALCEALWFHDEPKNDPLLSKLRAELDRRRGEERG